MFKVTLTTTGHEIVERLRELSQRWHAIDKELCRRAEANDYGEMMTVLSIELDDTRFEIMEIVLSL